MLKVIKRSGAEQPFDPAKIKNSLAATSDEIRQPMGSRDLDAIVKELLELIEGRESVSSRQILIIISGILYVDGYRGVLEAYINFKDNAWRN